MSDINKIVAAVLTAGRMPLLRHIEGANTMDDWLAEYNTWVETLDRQDAQQRAERMSDDHYPEMNEMLRSSGGSDADRT
jgi:hypothetical protein